MININGRTFYNHRCFTADVDTKTIYLDENGCGFDLETLYVNDIAGTKGRYNTAKKHYYVVLCHETGKYYNNAVECGKDLNINPRSINDYLNGSHKRNKIHGYTLSYIIARQKDEKLKYNAVDIDNIPNTISIMLWGYNLPYGNDSPFIIFDYKKMCEECNLKESDIRKCLGGWRMRAGKTRVSRLNEFIHDVEGKPKTKEVPKSGKLEAGTNFVKLGDRTFYKYARNGAFESWLDNNGAGFNYLSNLYINDPECKIGRWHRTGHCFALWCLNNGVIYNNAQEACDELGLNKRSLNTKIYNNECMVELKGIRFAYINVLRPKEDRQKHFHMDFLHEYSIEINNISTQPAIVVQIPHTWNNKIYYDIEKCAHDYNLRIDSIKKNCENTSIKINSKSIPMYYAKDWLTKEKD